jgi:hypothetical protein
MYISSIKESQWSQPQFKYWIAHKTIRVRTHAVLVIGLYELLGNPTT